MRHDPAYDDLKTRLIAARRAAGLTQVDVVELMRFATINDRPVTWFVQLR